MDLKPKSRLQAALPVLVGLGVFFVLAFGISYVWARQYDGKIAPNISIGPVEVGGMDPEEAHRALREKADALLAQGVNVRVGTQTKRIALATLVSGDLIEDVEYAMDGAVEQAKTENRTWMLIPSLWRDVIVPLTVSVNRESIRQSVYREFPDKETLAIDARFAFAQTDEGWTATVAPSSSGREFEWEAFFEKLETRLAKFDDSELELELVARTPAITEGMALEQTAQALELLARAPFSFTYTDERNRVSTHLMTQAAFSQLIVPTRNGKPAVDETAFQAFLHPIALALERPAQNARIEIEHGRVVEFVESKSGLWLDRDATYHTFEMALASNADLAKKAQIPLSLSIIEPTVKTGEVNDLGIAHILGTGTSSYRGSPANRKQNIQNGVRLLNGLLIPPGETFSLIRALQPFDEENGYLPELVIKGNKITPELGGGLCQIGTTTFRAAMNSGLPIVERRNHSIVVSYYNDPANNNPGTDATIYEPAPDFKFLNDTGSHILFQAENLTATQELRFTFWGTGDGRKGSYSAPVVNRWIPVGETQIVETTDLPVGKEQCQEAHIGADASFAYTIVRPDGTEENTTFASHYRPLPRICLVGTEHLSTETLAEETAVE